MTDGQMLLLVLWLVYVTECFLWLNKRTVAFVASWGRRWKVATASKFFGNASGGLLFLNPFPPLGRLCLNQPIPVSISPEYVTACNSQTLASDAAIEQTGEVLALSDIQEVFIRNEDLWLNGRLFCKRGAHANLDSLAELIDALRTMTPDERVAPIEAFWLQQFDAAAAQAEQASFQAQTTGLVALCNLQFVYLYVLLPGLTCVYGVARVLVPSAIAMVTLAVCVAVEFFRIHKQRYPAEREKRVSGAIKFVLCPPACIRAMDLVMVHSHSRHHSLTLASLLLPGVEGENYITAVLRDLRYPSGMASIDEEAASICKWQSLTVERLAAKQLPAVAACIRKLDEPPVPQAPDCESYCPRCLAQSTQKNAACPDCPGVALLPLLAPPDAGEVQN